MQTRTTDFYLNTIPGKEADSILRACVHCGFCTATCPTYQILGDELDGPRGRIYLIKQMLEGNQITSKTQTHLDRCLSCLACETTCPSGVQYGRLVDIARELTEKKVSRPILIRLKRFILRKLLPYPQYLKPMFKAGSGLKPLLPARLKKQIPPLPKIKPLPLNLPSNPRQMLALQGCVQSVATPNTQRATTSMLQKLGIELITAPKAGCCGAVSQHLSAPQEALSFMRNNIDAWWPYIQQNIETVVITASGCGAMIKEYGYLLRHDKQYAEKAKKVSELAKDISEVLTTEHIAKKRIKITVKHIAFQSPCSLQHGQKLDGVVESLLEGYGFELCHINDAHLCCGSAGTYSILQPELSRQLLDNKLAALQQHQPELIVTANIGCQLHMQTHAKVPVKHWIELLDESFV